MERTFVTTTTRAGQADAAPLGTPRTNKRYSLAESWEAEAPEHATNAQAQLAENWEVEEASVPAWDQASKPLHATSNATFSEISLAEDWEK